MRQGRKRRGKKIKGKEMNKRKRKMDCRGEDTAIRKIFAIQRISKELKSRLKMGSKLTK